MWRNDLKDALTEIHMPSDMKQRIKKNLTQPAKNRRVYPKWKRPLIAALAVLVCLAIPMTALAATVEPIYQLMYLVSPAVAQYFQPVQKSDTDNNVRMEVVSAYLHEDTAEIYITMQDLTENRIDETTDLYDSYSINSPFDSIGHCERVGYDPETKTVTFLITLSHMYGKTLKPGKVTFSVREFLSQKQTYQDIEIPIDLTNVPTATKTQETVDSSGGGGMHYDPDSFRALFPKQPDPLFPIDGIDFTGMAFVDGKLHIQMAVRDYLSNDNHGFLYLVDADGTQIQSDASYHFRGEGTDRTTAYIESVISVTPETLATCKLYGSFWISGNLTQGDWRVTFPLTQGN